MTTHPDVDAIEQHCIDSIDGRMPTRMEREQLELVALVRGLEAAVAKARQVHPRVGPGSDGHTRCDRCLEVYPCITLMALAGDLA